MAAESNHHQIQEDDDEEEEEVLTPSRRSLFRSASWSVRSSPPPPPSNLNPDSKPSSSSHNLPKPNRRHLRPLQPLRPPLTSWPHLNSGDLQTPHLPLPPYNDCSRISDHVYLGSASAAADRAALRRHSITHVLNCVGSRCPDHFHGDLVYKTLFLHDSPSEDLSSVLYDAFDYLELVRSIPKARVFVHCSKGASRSAAIVIAYLMWNCSKSFNNALSYVRSARAVTDPNLGFASQLLQCQNRVHALPPSPGSVVRVYRMAPHSPYDPLHLVPKAVDRPWLPKLDSRGAFLVVHVRAGIFIWLGRFCEAAMAASAGSAAQQVVRYEKVKVSVAVVREGSESRDFWDALIGEDHGDLDFEAGNRRVELYDLDFEIFKRAIKGGVLPPAPMPGTLSETCLPVRESGWNRVRKKLLEGNVKEVEEGENEEGQKEQFCSPGSQSGESSITSGDTASTFSPMSSSSLDSHGSSSPSGSDSYAAPSPIVVSKLPPLLSRRVQKRVEEKDSLAHRRGRNPPLLDLLRVESDEWRLSPRDIVRDWCLSPPFISDIEQPTSSGCQDEEEEENSSARDNNGHIWLTHPILLQWPSLEKVEEINHRALDSGSVFILLAPDFSPGKMKFKSQVLYLWLGRHCQFNGIEVYSDSRQIDLDRIRVDVIDRMALPPDVSLQIIREDEEPEHFLNHLFSFHGE